MGYRQRGSAMVETALLLPIYALLLVMAWYFGGLSVLRQELGLAARHGVQSPLPGIVERESPFGETAFFPVTAGPGLRDGWFLIWQGALSLRREDRTEPPYSPEQVHDDLVRESWRVVRTLRLDPATGEVRSEESRALTPVGQLVYMRRVRDRVAEISAWSALWQARRTSRLTIGDGSTLLGVPVPAFEAAGSGVARTGFERELRHIYRGSHPAARQVQGLPSAIGAYPVPGYPDYGRSGAFWQPN